MQHRRRRKRRGMTLIEVVVVMLIMATMAAAASLGVIKAWESSKKQDTASRARTMQAAATKYLLEEEGECPQVADLERAAVLDPTTEHEDAWDRAFVIQCEDTAVHVRSSGPDGALGTDDDIGF